MFFSSWQWETVFLASQRDQTPETGERSRSVGLSKQLRRTCGYKRETSSNILATTVTLLQFLMLFLKPASGISLHFTLNQMHLTEQVRVTQPLCKKKKIIIKITKQKYRSEAFPGLQMIKKGKTLYNTS